MSKVSLHNIKKKRKVLIKRKYKHKYVIKMKTVTILKFIFINMVIALEM